MKNALTLAMGLALTQGACAEDRMFEIQGTTVADGGADAGSAGHGGADAGSEGGKGGSAGQGGADAGAEGGADAGTECSDIETKCGSKCVDLYTDPNNCGGCENVCAGVKTACFNAMCQCEVGLQDCGEGTCVNLSNDNNNCGGCDNVCDSDKHCEDSFCK
jgi:hypothetical protein